MNKHTEKGNVHIVACLSRESVLTFNTEFFNNLLKTRNISRKKLADKTGIDYKTLRKIAQGHSPSPGVFMKISSAFDITPEKFLNNPPTTLQEYRWLKGLSINEAADKWNIKYSYKKNITKLKYLRNENNMNVL